MPTWKRIAFTWRIATGRAALGSERVRRAQDAINATESLRQHGRLHAIERWCDSLIGAVRLRHERQDDLTREKRLAATRHPSRGAAMKKMMEDPRMDPSTPGNPRMPFDGKPMIFASSIPGVEVTA